MWISLSAADSSDPQISDLIQFLSQVPLTPPSLRRGLRRPLLAGWTTSTDTRSTKMEVRLVLAPLGVKWSNECVCVCRGREPAIPTPPGLHPPARGGQEHFGAQRQVRLLLLCWKLLENQQPVFPLSANFDFGFTHQYTQWFFAKRFSLFINTYEVSFANSE